MPQAAPPPAAASSSAAWQDPYRNYNFKLEIQGVTQGHFTECSNIGIRIQAISYREAGAQQVVHRIPGPVDYADVVLKYGVTPSSSELWTWFLAASKGNVERKNVSIVLLDSAGANEVMRWNLNRAWPREWNGAPLNTGGNGAAIETLVLAFETLEKG
jgi:phage tail-like protein